MFIFMPIIQTTIKQVRNLEAKTYRASRQARSHLKEIDQIEILLCVSCQLKEPTISRNKLRKKKKYATESRFGQL